MYISRPIVCVCDVCDRHQLQGGESQLLLVTISQHIDTGQAEGVASLLLSQEHGVGSKELLSESI